MWDAVCAAAFLMMTWETKLQIQVLSLDVHNLSRKQMHKVKYGNIWLHSQQSGASPKPQHNKSEKDVKNLL